MMCSFVYLQGKPPTKKATVLNKTGFTGGVPPQPVLATQDASAVGKDGEKGVSNVISVISLIQGMESQHGGQGQ